MDCKNAGKGNKCKKVTRAEEDERKGIKEFDTRNKYELSLSKITLKEALVASRNLQERNNLVAVLFRELDCGSFKRFGYFRKSCKDDKFKGKTRRK
ncbi:hypothetical protein RCL_jg15883.t1 [Rhizophagus clarus]|uniref:Uncharacterized protein n=1 Tax=Rhizophagus clarus TaxID=94130 RepID=A0A8H3L6T9_9GLOM|nr:hypothetical protein RCL_jg15883.t1 [Rhizophagus clarus]